MRLLIVVIQYLKENFDSVKVNLSSEDVQSIRDLINESNTSEGDRYPPGMMDNLFADTPEEAQ